MRPAPAGVSLMGAHHDQHRAVMVKMIKPRKLGRLADSVKTIGRAGAVERIRGSALQVIRDRILTRDKGVCRCAECIRAGDVRAAHQVDHRRPLWEGGREADSNRYAIAIPCHQQKTACELRRRVSAAAWQCTCRRCLPEA